MMQGYKRWVWATIPITNLNLNTEILKDQIPQTAIWGKFDFKIL